MYIDHYEDAAEYCQSRRNNFEPALYNNQRLTEKPIPDIEQPKTICVDAGVSKTPNCIREPLCMPSDSGVNAPGGRAGVSKSPDCIREPLVLDIKQEAEPFDMNAADKDMFDVILNEEEVASGSVGDVSMEENDNNDSDATDVIFKTPSGSFPLPMPCTLDGLVKQENDIISGNLPFRTWVSLRQIQYFLFVICSFIYSIIIYRKTEDAHINVMANWWSCPNQQSKSSFIGIRMIRNLKTSNTMLR